MIASVASVTDVASLIVDGAGTNIAQRMSVVILNPGANTVYLGGSTVDSTSGFPLDNGIGNVFTIDMPVGEKLYGVCSSGLTQTLNIIRNGAV